MDVEEYFHVSAFESVVRRADWERWPRRLDVSMPVLLDRLERAGVRGTFFVLGWVAEKSPHVVKWIADAGHEVASHGFWHRRLTTLSRDEFRRDLRASKDVLEDLTGQPVSGFRAPSFSLVPGGEWAFDVLLEEGFRYDSSIFPIRRRGYGYPGSQRIPHEIHRPGGSLMEIPLATIRFAGMTIPAAGGGYLRQLPFALIRRAFREGDAQLRPATFYIHPWEIDPEQPRVAVSRLTRMRHYRGLAGTLDSIDRLLSEFRFTTIASYIDGFTPAMALPR